MKNVRRVLWGALIVAVLAVPLMAVPAGAQAPVCPTEAGPYPPQTSDLQLDRTVIERGGTFQAAACGLQPNTSVCFTLESHPILLGCVTVDSTGYARGTFTVPTHAHPGEHTVVASGFAADGRPLRLTARVRIIDPVTQAGTVTPARAGVTTPRTGADVAPWLILAVAVLGAGLVLLKIGRRNKGDVPA
ncbi:MAG TPA: hypothetical protein VND22_07420 [Actinomycetota bacterium]|nr:hypothetical protein [Actinomycetota bacterium]